MLYDQQIGLETDPDPDTDPYTYTYTYTYTYNSLKPYCSRHQ